MSRGFGAIQRKVLDALEHRRDNDTYDTKILGNFLDLSGVVEQDEPTIRARWRWYTVDLLGLTPDADAGRCPAGDPRSHRVSLHRAVRNLHQAGEVEIATTCPYPPVLGGFDYDDDDSLQLTSSGLPLWELHDYVDPRWPDGPGRRLWFRLPPPALADVPLDDQIAILNFLHLDPWDFQEFTETVDRKQAWESEVGRFVRWLFCGPPP